MITGSISGSITDSFSNQTVSVDSNPIDYYYEEIDQFIHRNNGISECAVNSKYYIKQISKNKILPEPVDLSNLEAPARKDSGYDLQTMSVFILLKDTIKNYRPLSNDQLQYIHTLSNEQLIEIILLYNKMIMTLENII